MSIKRHLFLFLGFVLAFFAPIQWYIVSVQLSIWTEYLTRQALKKKRPVQDNGILSVAMIMGMSIFLILAAHTAVLAFHLPKWMPLPYLVGGYISLWNLQQAAKNFDLLTGENLSEYLNKTIFNFLKSFNPIKKNNK